MSQNVSLPSILISTDVEKIAEMPEKVISTVEPVLSKVDESKVLLSEREFPPLEATVPKEENKLPQPEIVQRLKKPNKALQTQQLSLLFNEAEKLLKRKYEIGNTIFLKHQMRERIANLRKNLANLGATFRLVLDEKKALREQLYVNRNTKSDIDPQVRANREKIPFTWVEEIDEETRQVNLQLSHSTVTIHDERRLVAYLSELRKSKQVLKNYHIAAEQIAFHESSRAGLVQEIKEKNHILNSIHEQQEQLRQALTEATESDALSGVELPALVEERNAAFNRIKDLRNDANYLKYQFNVEEDKYWEAERKWKALQKSTSDEHFTYKDRAMTSRQKLRNQRVVEPFSDEIMACDQLLAYLRKLAPLGEISSASTSSTTLPFIAPKGVGNVIVGKKTTSDAESDAWLTGSSSSLKGKKLKGGRGPKSKEILSLSLDALASFENLKLSPPTVVSHVNKSIDEIQARKQNFIQLKANRKQDEGMKSNQKSAQLVG